MLVIIKLVHTVIWAIMAAAVVSIPILGWLNHFGWALGSTVLILFECLALAANRGRCPLTNLAARHTEARADNFDIYLPQWLARHNKLIFGSIFILGEFFLGWRWLVHQWGG